MIAIIDFFGFMFLLKNNANFKKMKKKTIINIFSLLNKNFKNKIVWNHLVLNFYLN